MSTFKPIITVAGLVSSIPIVDGQLVAACDTGDMYVDKDGIRTKYCDVDTRTYAEISVLQNPLEGKIYFATDTHQLLQASYDTNDDVVWTVLNDRGESSVVNIVASGDVTQPLENNTIYYITGTIGTIALSVDSEMSYCTVCFTAGQNTVFTHIAGSRCIGFDCSGGIFTPVNGKEYQIAIDKLNNILTLYVLRLN